MNKVTVTTQEELNAIDADFNGEIHVIGVLNEITKHYKNAEVYVSGNAQITNVYGNAQISNVSGNAVILHCFGNAQIRYVYDNAQIRNVSDNAQIRNVSGNAVILHCFGNASIQTFGQNIISYGKSQTNLKINASPNTTIVILDELNTTFDSYEKFYPVEIKDGYAILYKSVHKTTDGRYVSDKDRNFEYKIGETKEHLCDPSTNESCGYGLHVSHKMWALKFGRSWSDMALLEVRVPIDKIVVAKDCDGKVRTSQLEVLREVPEEEWYK